MHLSKVAFH